MTQDSVTLNLDLRTVTGKAVKHLRRDGIVPAVINDHGKPSINVQGDYLTLIRTYRVAGRHKPVDVVADGKKYTTIIKFATFEPRKNRLNHIVFDALTANEKVEAEVPIVPRFAEGNTSSPAELAGLMIIHNAEEITVKGMPKNLPDAFEYDAEKLVEIGDRITVGDLTIPSDIELITEAGTVIATVYEPSAVAAANDAAGGTAEPGDEAAVESDHESSAEEGTQKDEIRPGGKKEFEDKSEGHSPEKK